ncbi:MAG: hypothetical protein Q7U97_11495 [Rhodocyclaceae bacterium]|nr:hypothetical protein [Rhodocyclaceae bacterium]
MAHFLRVATICAATLAASSGTALALAPAIPETLEAYEIGEPDALQKMRACNPRLNQEALDRMLQKAAKNDTATITTILAENDRSAVVEKGGLWLCVQMSPQRYPVLPLDSIAAVAKPEGADPGRLKDFFRTIAAALAETGFARALVPFATTGNANALFFAVSAENPGQIAVDTRFLKKDGFNATEYSLQLNDPNVRSIATTGPSGGDTRRDIFVGKFATRKVVGGYLIRKGNDLTRRFDFAGTIWKQPTSLSTSYTFQKEGVVVYKSKANTSFGSWKVEDGVLYFDVNKYAFYSAVLDERSYLNSEARNSPRSANGATSENRFKPRFFQEGNVEAEKEAREKLDSAFKTLQSLLAVRKNEVLTESAEDEERQQPTVRKRLTLCDMELLPAIMTLADEKGVKPGEVCHSYLGTRSEWKSSILKDGCQGRCQPL